MEIDRLIEKLFGNCSVCGRYLGKEAYTQGEVIAVVGYEGTVVGCSKHCHDAPNGPEYRNMVRKMAQAKAAQLGVFN